MKVPRRLASFRHSSWEEGGGPAWLWLGGLVSLERLVDASRYKASVSTRVA